MVRRRRELQYHTDQLCLTDDSIRKGHTIIISSDSLIEAGQLCRGEKLVFFVSQEVGL